MMKKLWTVTLALIILSALSITLFAQTDNDNDQNTYKVTITSLTAGVEIIPGPKGQVLSPPVVATHTRHLAPLYVLGAPASSPLIAIAEDAVNQPLVDELTGNPDVKDVEQGTAPIPPGQSASVTVQGGGRFSRITVVGMLVETNDSFYALNGVRLPEHGSITYFSPAYSSGSEVNNELCKFVPGPPCNSHNVRDPDGAPGYVHISLGIHGIGNLPAAQFDWRNPVVKITITRMHGDQD